MDIDAICPLVSVWRAYSTFITKALIFILMVSKHEAIKCSWFQYSKTRARGVTALTRAVSGEKQIYSGNLEILPGIGKPGKFFGKYEIFSGH